MGFWAQKNRRSSSSLPLFFVFLLVIIFLENSVGVVSALDYSNDKQSSRSRLKRIQKYLAMINKSAVLSINSPDGDIIDCVDKWKQPAFDHPLLKNHTLQLAPSKLPFKKENEQRGEEIEFNKRIPAQVWHLNGTSCPKDTVPIRRTTVKDMLMAKSLRRFMRKQPNTGFAPNNTTISPNVHDDVPDARYEYAVAKIEGSQVFGAGATVNLWNPSIGDPLETSLAQIWIYDIPPNEADLNIIEAGWHVYPKIYGGMSAQARQTRLFVYWTSDNYRTTGCYNLMCPGFVRTGSFIVPGMALTPMSIVNGPQFDATFNIYQDSVTGHWWLTYGVGAVTFEVGYFPGTLVPLLRNGARGANWGGEVSNRRQNGGRRGEHTLTEMGSGRFAHEEFGHAGYFRQIYVVREDWSHITPQITSYGSTHPLCYSITPPTWESSYSDMGFHFYYGGNGGGNPDCYN